MGGGGPPRIDVGDYKSVYIKSMNKILEFNKTQETENTPKQKIQFEIPSITLSSSPLLYRELIKYRDYNPTDKMNIEYILYQLNTTYNTTVKPLSTARGLDITTEFKLQKQFYISFVILLCVVCNNNSTRDEINTLINDINTELLKSFSTNAEEIMSANQSLHDYMVNFTKPM